MFAAYPLPAWYSTSYAADPIGGNSGRPPLNGTLKYHSHFFGRGSPGSRPGDSHPPLCGQRGIRWAGSEERTVIKAAHGERTGLAVFTRAIQVTVYS